MGHVTHAAAHDADQLAVFEFGDFELDARRQLLRCLPAGAVVDLTPKAFAVLHYLVTHAGRVVAKSELLAAVWPNVVVEESNLTQSVHMVRRALREVPDDHRYVVTVPGRGYRFVAPVVARAAGHDDGRREPAPTAIVASSVPPATLPALATDTPPTATLPAAAPPPLAPIEPARALRGARRWAIAAALVLATLVLGGALYAWRTPAPPMSATNAASIAVLPFADLSPGRDRAFFADGLAEEVLNRLARQPELRVIARTSSFSFRGRDVDVATIGRALDVGHVLEGSVRTDGERMRVTAHLIETRHSSEVWSQTFDRPLSGVFEVQDEIAGAVAAALSARLVAAAPAGRATPSPRAYEHVLRGQYFLARRGDGDLARAEREYRAATSIDPRYARAWAGLASALYLRIAEREIARATGLPFLHEAASRAVELDPQFVEGHFRLAASHYLRGDRRLASLSFQRGAALEPDHPLVIGMRAGLASARGDFDKSIALLTQVASRDPLSVVTLTNLGHAYFLAGRYDEAEARFRDAVDLGGGLNAQGMLSQILIVRGRFDAALALVDEGRTDAETRDACLAMIHHAQGRHRESDEALRRLVAVVGDEDPVTVAEVHAWRGERDLAFQWLERAARRARAATSDPYVAARTIAETRASPFLRRLHDDPRWQTWDA